MKSIILLYAFAISSGVFGKVLDELRDHPSPPGVVMSVASVPAPPDFAPRPTTASNPTPIVTDASSTQSLQVGLQTEAAMTTLSATETLLETAVFAQSETVEPVSTQSETVEPVSTQSETAEIEPLEEESKAISPSQDIPQSLPDANQNIQSTDAVTGPGRSSPGGPSSDQNSQSSNNSSEESFNAPDKSTATGIIIAVSLSVVALAIGGIFFGLPTFKKWVRKDDSSLSNPNWEAIREERKNADLELYYDSFKI